MVYTIPKSMVQEIWDRCEALVAPERYWARFPEVVSLSIDTSVKSPLGTGSIRVDIPATPGVWDIYVVEKFNEDASLLFDFTVIRPSSIFVQSPQATEWRIEVVTRETPGIEPNWNIHEVARQTVPANTMTEILLDYSGIPDASLLMTAQVSVIAFVNQLAFSGYVSGIAYEAEAPPPPPPPPPSSLLRRLVPPLASIGVGVGLLMVARQ